MPTTAERKEYLPVTVCNIKCNVAHNKESMLGVGSIPGRVKESRIDSGGNEVVYNRISNRLLAAHVEQIREKKWTHIVCLVPLEELKELHMVNYVKRVSKLFNVIHLPIKDGHAPSLKEANRIIPYIASTLSQGGNVLVHCRCGLGRAGTIVAATMLHYGLSVEKAISLTRKQRPGAIQTRTQESFLAEYARNAGFSQR